MLLWRFTGFYGNPITSFRAQSWQLLLRLADIHELKVLPLLVGWDFNEIVFDSEKMGGLSKAFNQMSKFSNILDECGLHDIPSKGDLYTWWNNRQGDDIILTRLDRFVCNYDWNLRFPDAAAKNLAYYGSDHRSVSIILKPILWNHWRKGPKRFTFEHKWFMEEDFSCFFKQSWQDFKDSASLPICLS